jgi:hypothetical protein
VIDHFGDYPAKNDPFRHLVPTRIAARNQTLLFEEGSGGPGLLR